MSYKSLRDALFQTFHSAFLISPFFASERLSEQNLESWTLYPSRRAILEWGELSEKAAFKSCSVCGRQLQYTFAKSNWNRKSLLTNDVLLTGSATHHGRLSCDRDMEFWLRKAIESKETACIHIAIVDGPFSHSPTIPLYRPGIASEDAHHRRVSTRSVYCTVRMVFKHSDILLRFLWYLYKYFRLLGSYSLIS
ncbi:uncharacterized protein YALI1_A04864g [Yarrowia lipolytica]|uniref:Uncharacterized protein n=1 Tax=Yarrowia lipolytica TaxID=4952 RepID=A0A1D8N3Q7_YARLL|nr:hypothetical protein YALI1_A04864g [Yarrowia lipolytica]